MCNSEQNIELNLCQILERINQCCLNNEELNSIRQQIESVQTWINSFEADLTTNSVVLSEAIDVFPINTPIQVVLEYLYETLQTITPSNKQEAIQFKEGGVNLGTSGTVDNINFIGDVEVTRIGDALTVNVVGSATDLTVANRTATTLDVTSSSGNDAAIPSATTSLAGLISAADKTKLDGIQTGAEANVQSDWNVLDNTSDAFILNKPTIPSITGLAPISYVDNQDALKQDLLVSGTNIKTINGNSLLGSGNLTIAGGGGGETNTASNVGVAGVGIFKQKTGVDLEFKKLNAGSNKITITDDVANNEVDVDVVVANLTGIAQSQITNLTTDLSNKQETLVSGTNIKTINSTSLLGSGNINIDLSVKQTNIQFQDEGVSLGTSGTVDVINFTGASITASRTGNTVTIDVTGGGGGGATNLAYNASPTNGVVTSDTGTDATIPLADGTNAGLLAPAQFTKLSNISITQPIDLDQLESDTTTNNAKVSNATHTGDVSGSTILTLATVNSNVGTFGSGTQIPQFVVNGKGLITSVSNVTITPAASSITGAGNITKVDDTNVTLTLGGTPTGSVLNSVSFTLGWTGTLADGRIASASNWNSAYTNRITSLTTTGNSGASTLISNVLNIPNYTLAGLGGISLTSLSSTATGLTYTNTTGVFSLTSGYVIPTTTQETNWNTAYTNRITSLTTTGSSGAATLISNVLNIPNYTLAGLGGQPLDADLTAIAALTGTSGFLKTNGAGTWTVDTNTYLTGNQSITLSGEASGSGTTGISVTLSNSAVIGKVLTGFTSTTGTILATDSILQAIQKLDGNLAAATAGGVSSVTGTTNRITSTGGSNPIIDISASYVGQSSITTLGTITTGVWNGTAIGDSYISSASTWNAKQTAYTNLTSIGTLANAAGVLTNDGSGVFSYATVTGYTTEEAQDAVGAMVDSTLVYVDATPLLTRAALTGAITASQGSNTTSLGSFTLSQLNTAISDADVATGGGTATGTNTGDNAVNTLYSGLVSNATHTGDATGATALTVVGINGTLLSGLTTGILKNTTGTGVPSIAVAGDFPTLNQNTTGSAATLTTGRTIAITGDLAYTSPSFNGSGNVTAVGTLATVNANVGSFGNATQVASFTVNAKGLITAASNITITPSASSITGGAALTKVDDTNVTLTLGGSPTTALLGATSLTLGWTGVLSTSRGGTGIGTLGTALQQLRVNAGGTALEYFTPSGGGITSLNALTGATQTFTNDTNVTIVSGGTAHVITWSGTLADSRITSASNWNSKQAGILFKDEGVALGATSTVDEINFTGNGISASRVGNVVTVDVGATSGVTNLTYTTSATNGIVVSDTGSDATIPAADGTNAGLMIPAQFNKLEFVTVTQAVNLDTMESDIATNNAKVTNATHTGDVTGSTALTLATVNSNVGTFGSASTVPILTVNAKGLVTAVSTANLTSTSLTDFVEASQDAIGAMIDSSLVYVDATPLLSRAALTGDVTASQGSNVTTIANNVVSNAKLATMAANTFKGNNTGSTANAIDLNVAQMQAALSVDDLVTLSGVADGAVNLGTFTGTVIPDSSTVKTALQSLETSLEANYVVTNRTNKIRVVSVNTTLSATTDGTVVFDTAGTVATLPSPTNELMLVVKNVSNGNITVTGHLDGVAAQTFTIASLESFRFHSNGTTFYIIA